MAKIKVSNMVSKECALTELDASGETKVVVKPPSWQEEKARGALLAQRKYYHDEYGQLVTEVDCNIRELWEAEIWLTFERANLEVEIEQTDGSEKSINIQGHRDEFKYTEFMEKLGQMPPQVIMQWHLAVISVVPAWRNPF